MEGTEVTLKVIVEKGKEMAFAIDLMSKGLRGFLTHKIIKHKTIEINDYKGMEVDYDDFIRNK